MKQILCPRVTRKGALSPRNLGFCPPVPKCSPPFGLGDGDSHENQSLQIEIILQGAGSNKKSLLQSTVQFQYSIFTFTVSSPQKTHLQRIRPPNQDYYAPCPVYIHLTKKNTVFFWFREKNPSPQKKSPCFSWPPLNFQGCLAA